MGSVSKTKKSGSVLGLETVGINVGCDLGKLRDYTAVVVAESQVLETGEHFIARHIERAQLGTDYTAIGDRLWGIYQKLCGLVRETNEARATEPKIVGAPGPFSLGWPELLIDVTGLGGPFIDFFIRDCDRRIAAWQEEQTAHETAVEEYDLLGDKERAETPEPESPGPCPVRPQIVSVSITGGDRDRQQDDPAGRAQLHVGKEALVSRLQVVLGTHRLSLPKCPETEELARELKAFEGRVTKAQHVSYNAREGEHDDLVIAAALAVWRRAQTLMEQVGVHT